ncbi:MAG TPA: hypothetical protein PKC28_15820 [Bdellovibrionales bacterium]|nr:hypothetical protein [Bdellovibrionales bacterium]
MAIASVLLPERRSAAFVVTRQVTFPYPMTYEHYESLGVEYCDSSSIQAFCNRLRLSGDLLSIEEKFESHRITYLMHFRDEAAYHRYLSTINQNWFNFENFEKIGFQVKLLPHSYRA